MQSQNLLESLEIGYKEPPKIKTLAEDTGPGWHDVHGHHLKHDGETTHIHNKLHSQTAVHHGNGEMSYDFPERVSKKVKDHISNYHTNKNKPVGQSVSAE